MENVNKIDVDNIGLEEVVQRMELLNKKYELFEQVQDSIDDSCGNKDELQIQFVARNQADELYCYAIVRLKALLKALSPIANNSATDGENEKKGLNDIKLPRINVPTFSGKYEEWISFHDLFKSLIHGRNSLSNAEKLHYLKSNLSGDAALLLRSFQITDDNYEEAWNLLCERFDNKRYIIDCHLKALFNLPSLTQESSFGIRRILDTALENVRALEALKIPVEGWDAILVYMINAKLDNETQRQWQMTLSKDLPSFTQFCKFLESKYQSLEMIHSNKPHSTMASIPRPATNTKSFQVVATKSCGICKEEHLIHKCPDYINMDYNQRTQTVREKNLCYNCLKFGHSAQKCISGTCLICGKKHHSSLHRNNNSIAVQRSSNESLRDNNATYDTNSHLGNYSGNVLLATACVDILTSNGTFKKVRALIDSGSQCSFISEAALQRLHLVKKHLKVNVHGLGKSNAGTTSGVARLKVRSAVNSDFAIEIEALVIGKLTSALPTSRIHKADNWKHLQNLALADWTYNEPGNIDLIIGADVYGSLLLDGIIRGPKGSPFAQNTQFGWIIFGPVMAKNNLKVDITNLHTCLDIDSNLKAFWEIEEMACAEKLKYWEDIKCEQHFEETHSGNMRDGGGFGGGNNDGGFGNDYQQGFGGGQVRNNNFGGSGCGAGGNRSRMNLYGINSSGGGGNGTGNGDLNGIGNSGSGKKGNFNDNGNGTANGNLNGNEDGAAKNKGAGTPTSNGNNGNINGNGNGNLTGNGNLNGSRDSTGGNGNSHGKNNGHLNGNGIRWHFNPPSAPHFGGLWEAGIKSVKYHLKRILDTSVLTFEEMVKDFWKRWQNEFLTQLQQRSKWLKNVENIKIDDLIIIKEDNYPPSKWHLGRILEVHPGKDGKIRVATIKTINGTVQRTISKICVLPIQDTC